MRLVSLMFGVSLLTIVCSQSALSQDSTENIVLPDTLLHLSLPDSTALEEIKALIKDGQYAEAESQARELLAKVEAEHGVESLEAAKVLDQLVESLWRGGKAADEESEDFAKRAVSIKEQVLGPQDSEVATSLNNLANFYYNQGKYAEAEPLHKRALAIWEKALGPEHPHVAVSLNNLADLYTLQGKYAEAEPLFKRSLAIEEKAFDPEHPNVAYGLYNLANLYHDQGKYAEAEPLYERALAILEKALGPEHPRVASSLNSLANLYENQGKYAQAEPLNERALAIWEKALGPEHPNVAVSLNNLAILYSIQGRHTKADSLYVQSIAVSEKAQGTEHPNLARYLQFFSKHCRRAGNNKKAVDLAGRAFTIRKKNFRDHSSGMSERDALTYSQFLRESASGFLSTYFDLDTTGGNMDNSTADVLFSTKGSVMDGIFDRRRTLVKETDSTTLALAETLRLTKSLLSELFVQGPGEDVEGYRSEIDSLSKLANEQEADLARHSASFRRQQDYKNVSSERIASLLPGNSVLVEYVKYDFQQLKPDSSIPHYLVLVLDADVEPVIVDLGEASEIEPLVDRYRRHLLSVSSSSRVPTIVDIEDYKKISEALYEKVWEPVAEHISDNELVFVAPDGGLNMLSFAGLIDDDGKYLIEKFAFHYLSSGRDLIRLKDRPSPATGLFALGDPDFNATVAVRLEAPVAPADTISEPVYYASTRNVRSGCGELKELTVNPLPGTRTEVEQIVKSWKESSTEPIIACMGSDASEEKFKAEAPGSRVIHLATHGYFLEGACQPSIPTNRFGTDVGYAGENPLLLSGLFLAGANLHGEGSNMPGAEDGILTAYEVSEMVLDGTELVVLSACETGLGEVQEGEGVYGLRRAFQMAGARTVISALWPVSDKATADLMSRLYDRKSEPLPKSFRRIQLESIEALRSQGKPDHPFTWGAFIALGDWR